MPASVAIRINRPGATHRALRSKMAKQLILEHAARLGEQAAVEWLVWHLITPVSRMRSLQPTGYLLGRPFQSELPCHGLPKPRIGRQLTTFWTTSARPGILVRKCRSGAIIAAIAAHFPPYRRG